MNLKMKIAGAIAGAAIVGGAGVGVATWADSTSVLTLQTQEEKCQGWMNENIPKALKDVKNGDSTTVGETTPKGCKGIGNDALYGMVDKVFKDHPEWKSDDDIQLFKLYMDQGRTDGETFFGDK